MNRSLSRNCCHTTQTNNTTETMNEFTETDQLRQRLGDAHESAAGLRARIASLESELASHFKRRAAIEAMEAYKAHASTHAQEIADEASWMLDKFLANPNSYPVTAEYLRLRNEADRLRKEVQP